MCLGVPGQVIEWRDRDAVFGRALIEFDGIRRVCQMACVPDAEVGEYVVVHAGLAISRIDAAAARKLLEELGRLGLQEEFPESESAHGAVDVPSRDRTDRETAP